MNLDYSFEGMGDGDSSEPVFTATAPDPQASAQPSPNYVEQKSVDLSQLDPGLITNLTSIADSSVERSLAMADKVYTSPDVQQFIKDQGLAPYLKDVTKDHIKSVLSLFGLWWISQKLKSKVAVIGLMGLGAYVYISNQDKTVAKVVDKVA